MKKFLLLSMLLATPAFSEVRPGPGICSPQDSFAIRDEGPDKAIVTYTNSANKCSNQITLVLISKKNKIEVKIRIIVGGGGEKEEIILTPSDPMMMSFPPDGLLFDGETKEFVIMGGIS